MVGDLPDYRQYVTPITVSIPEGQEAELIPRPKGEILEKGSITTTAAYQTVASRTVTNAKQFQLSKITISTTKAAYFRLKWAGSVISARRFMDDLTTLIEHFPWDYYEMIGDGSKALVLEAIWDTEAGSLDAEIVGEEID